MTERICTAQPNAN